MDGIAAKALVLYEVRFELVGWFVCFVVGLLVFNKIIRKNIWQWRSCLEAACKGVFLHFAKKTMVKSSPDLS